MYKIATKATNPMKKMDALMENGNCKPLFVTMLNFFFLTQKVLEDKLAN